MKQVAWSEHEETWTRRILWFDFYLLGVLGVGELSVLILRQWIAVWVCLAAVLFFLGDLFLQARKYRAMMLNRPRSTYGLTPWVQLRPWQTEICCACGAVVQIDRAGWHPNEIDPGGGRFAMVCACGIGYFKLKEQRLEAGA